MMDKRKRMLWVSQLLGATAIGIGISALLWGLMGATSNPPAQAGQTDRPQMLLSNDEQQDKTRRPRILVTNDDGVHSPGLKALVKELATFADVNVCVPSKNRSGSSQAVSYFSSPPMLVCEHQIEGAVKAVTLDGSPADAAHFGIMQFGKEKPFDLLISGMNNTSNVGDLSHGSGTVGAAMEGAFRGVPSMAVSLGGRYRDLKEAAGFARQFAQQWLKRGAKPDVVFSLNIPPRPEGGWKGVKAAPMGGSYMRVNSYREVKKTDDGVIYRANVVDETEFPKGSDSEAFKDGFVTITPLRFDWTHREALADVVKWDLEAK